MTRLLIARNAKLIALCLVVSLATIGATAAVTMAGPSGSGNAQLAKKKKKKAFSKAQLKLVKKYARSYAKKYAKAGPAGTAGAAGAAGAPGLVASFAATNAADLDLPNDGSANISTITKELPAGKYVVDVNVAFTMISDNATDTFGGSCTAETGTTVLANGAANALADQFAFIFDYGNINVPMKFQVDLPAAATIAVKCSSTRSAVASSGYGVSINPGGAQLQALQVASIG